VSLRTASVAFCSITNPVALSEDQTEIEKPSSPDEVQRNPGSAYLIPPGFHVVASGLLAT